MPQSILTIRIRRILIRLTKYPAERGFLMLIPLMAASISALTIVEGFILKDTVFILAYLISAIVFVCAYFLLKIVKDIRIPAYLMVADALLLSNYIWFRFEGSNGTGPIMFLVLLFCICLFFKSVEKFLILLVIFSNLFVLMYVEYYLPDTIKPYSDKAVRLADLVFTYTVCGIFIVFVVQIILRSYAQEKSRSEQVERLKSSFLSNISHEVRTPLNAILGFSNLLIKDGNSPRDRNLYYRFLRDACRSLTNQIDEIIDIARIESNQMNIQKLRCNITDIMEMVFTHITDLPELQVSDALDFRITPRNLENNVFIKTDSTLVKQVLINLLENAVKFTQKGYIEYGYHIRKSDLLFYVKDSGIGIPPEEQEWIFDDFSKLQQDKDNLYRGVGLGLALSKKMLDLLNGNIWVNSEVGKGSTFWFSLPFSCIEVVPRNYQKKRSYKKEYVL